MGKIGMHRLKKMREGESIDSTLIEIKFSTYLALMMSQPLF